MFCEGYDHEDDEYILRGSCSLQYSLSYIGNTIVSYDEGMTPEHPADEYIFTLVTISAFGLASCAVFVLMKRRISSSNSIRFSGSRSDEHTSDLQSLMPISY